MLLHDEHYSVECQLCHPYLINLQNVEHYPMRCKGERGNLSPCINYFVLILVDLRTTDSDGYVRAVGKILQFPQGG